MANTKNIIALHLDYHYSGAFMILRIHLKKNLISAEGKSIEYSTGSSWIIENLRSAATTAFFLFSTVNQKNRNANS